MTVNTVSETLSGWGRYNPESCLVCRPERQAQLTALLDGCAAKPFIARGLGRSYGDAAVNGSGLVVDMSRLNRVIAFDAQTGMVDCEGGVSLATLLDAFAPRGFFPPVTPGTKFVTVAGAIANDVHGKNHHCDGTFSRFVSFFDLWTPARGVLRCSPQENADIFWATVGGVGLTGVILRARVQLRRIESAYMRVDYLRCPCLDDALAAMDDSDNRYTYSVAWVDCLASRASLGRSVLMRGNHVAESELPTTLARAPRQLPRRLKLSVPVDFPGFALNTYSIQAFNTLFYAKHGTRSGALVDYDRYFYPLDSIHQWNRMYGARGFIQYQATFPREGREGLNKMLEMLAGTRRASFLAVLKCFGESNPGLLSHPMPGYTLTLDLPNKSGVVEFARALDRVLLDHGGRLYLAKDSVALPETFAAMYPGLDAFRAIRNDLDPDSVCDSSLSRRLRLSGNKERAQ